MKKTERNPAFSLARGAGSRQGCVPHGDDNWSYDPFTLQLNDTKEQRTGDCDLELGLQLVQRGPELHQGLVTRAVILSGTEMDPRLTSIHDHVTATAFL